MDKRNLPLAAVDFIPHSGRMCCIDQLVELDAVGAAAEVRLRPGHILLTTEGVLEPCGFIELGAQTAAVMQGAQAATGSLGLAMLVNVQKVAITGAARQDDNLRVSVTPLGEIEGMLSLQFAVHHKLPDNEVGPLLATGRLTAYVPANRDKIAAMTLPEPLTADFSGSRHQSLTAAVAACAVDAHGETEIADCHSLGGSFVFPPDFAGFDGHFSGNPIVPGIVQIMCAVHTATGGRSGKLTGVKRCKFQRPVRPGEVVRVQVAVAGDAAAQSWRAQLSANGEPCAEIAFTFV